MDKRYEEALERAKAGKPIDEVFPELKESEDERIRKEIVRFIKESPDMGALTTKRYEQWLAWLEKQKDEAQKQFTLGMQAGREEVLYEIEKQKEQKPNIELIQRSWYMEGYHDRKFGKEPKWIIKTGEGGPEYEENPKYGQMLKEQKLAEWSEEDYCIFSSILSSINNLEYFAGMPAWKVSAWPNSAFTEQKRLTYDQIIKDIAMSIPECSVILMPGGEDEALLMKLLKTLKELSPVPVKDGKTRYRFTDLIEWVEDKLNKLQKCAKSNTESNQSLMYEL